MADAEDKAGTEIAGAEDPDYHLIVSYVTATAGPPHKVVVRDSIHGWVDVPMTAVEFGDQTTWSADLTSSPGQGPMQVEFKLVLDERHWMAGSNQFAKTGAPQATVQLDDSTVEWEE